MGAYARPRRLEDAVAAMAARPLIPLAGGTDYYAQRVGQPLDDDLLDLSDLGELAGIAAETGGWRIGARATWAEIAAAPLPPVFDALKAAARMIGGPQIQNAGTIGGNLCNASPAADGAPCLLALDAEVELAGPRGRRSLPLADFLIGPRRTARAADEILTQIRVPTPPAGARAAFGKLGARSHLVISIVMTAVVGAIADGRIAWARVAVGACAPTARRLRGLEARLPGLTLAEAAATVAADPLAELAPIDDVRGPAAYRLDAARTLIGRGLAGLA